MKKTIFLNLAIMLLVTFGFNNGAMAIQWKVDADHSGIYFGINHIYSTVKGYFNEFESTIDFDPEHLADSRFDFTVNVKSINTNNGKRDSHLLSEDFFDAEKYPEMTFKSSAISRTAGNQYIVEGTLTIKDVSQTIRLPFTFFGVKENPFNKKQLVAGFETRLEIDRLAYHVGSGKFHQMGVVGKDVKVLITVEAIRDK